MKPILVIDGKPTLYYSYTKSVQLVTDGYENGCLVRSVLPDSFRAEVVTRRGEWMLFKGKPQRHIRPSGRPVDVYGKPDSTYQSTFVKAHANE